MLKYKASCLLATVLTAGVVLQACTPQSEGVRGDAVTTSASETSELAPIRRFLACLPEEAALVAAHRGTGDYMGVPENSLSGLRALIEQEYLMAEIDVAKIKDGTLISFHDGVWDDKSSGRGPVVATTATEFSRIRLRESEGGSIGGEPVPTLAELLDLAKDKIYLEVDFKTSADIPRVIEALRARDMADQVVLIAMSDDDTDILRAYADEFLLSLPGSTAMDSQGVWVGGGWRDGVLTDLPSNPVIIGAQWRKEGPSGARPLDILVTDEISRFDPVQGLTDKNAFKTCLSG